MFTGIIEGFGKIGAIRSTAQSNRFAIDSEFVLDHTKIGDSIAVNGACLTAVRLDDRRFEVDVSPETFKTTTLAEAKIGDRVNLERAMRFSDRIDGHLVSGHIDGVGTIKRRESLGNAIILTVEIPESLTRYMIVKGSVAVDGTSLTVNTCERNSFSVSIIPHTAKWSTIGFKGEGDRVNIETDMIGKYVERFLSGSALAEDSGGLKGGGIDVDFLTKTGFIKSHEV
jgi:riboflavin synthase